MKALWEAVQVRQCEAADAGFDWPDVHGVLDKLREEVGELAEAAVLPEGDECRARCLHELGDLLFVLAHLSRRLEADPEVALEQALMRFNARFSEVMRNADQLPPLGDPSRLEVMEARWKAAKRRGL
ncbi:MazG family protein [Algiphilus sp. NNCM1]|uniref:MazG nucleotide pyrophosphohydrolase domain-containing protein n=1 Tax=Algiphilus sp. TaxID=1872431 RepID=UPI001CA65983|nr:MazG nucleotide pyrophosphohydrolase domain-containing protein [Algiphilus sp.]MBY8965289.1 MazG family protein [Algiphilus acroporae]MCI5063437.1 MazG family protein [Algiphilus sp.]MCI5103314.1 MazG family protein [Algiphilus sp.]